MNNITLIMLIVSLSVIPMYFGVKIGFSHGLQSFGLLFVGVIFLILGGVMCFWLSQESVLADFNSRPNSIGSQLLPVLENMATIYKIIAVFLTPLIIGVFGGCILNRVFFNKGAHK